MICYGIIISYLIVIYTESPFDYFAFYVILYRSMAKEGLYMLLKLNRVLRNIVLVIGALCIVFKLAESKANKKSDQSEEFQTVEFDDIW